MRIVVIDYDVGNIGSIINMLKRIGVSASLSHDKTEIENADKLILPGVGAFDHGMTNLQNANLIALLHDQVKEKKKPILGICLGMQMLLESSEEGVLAGLGWIKGRNSKFKLTDNQLKVPHMGWNTVKGLSDNPFLTESMPSRFYFVHSYHANCTHPHNVIGITKHDYEFPSIIRADHIVGTQFHPEKSHKYGMQLLKNFIEFDL